MGASRRRLDPENRPEMTGSFCYSRAYSRRADSESAGCSGAKIDVMTRSQLFSDSLLFVGLSFMLKDDALRFLFQVYPRIHSFGRFACACMFERGFFAHIDSCSREIMEKLVFVFLTFPEFLVLQKVSSISFPGYFPSPSCRARRIVPVSSPQD